jgi:hypothetical protein
VIAGMELFSNLTADVAGCRVAQSLFGADCFVCRFLSLLRFLLGKPKLLVVLLRFYLFNVA